MRSFKCLLRDYISLSDQTIRHISVDFSWEAYIYNDTTRDPGGLGNLSSELTVLQALKKRLLNPLGSNQRLVVVMAFGAWYKPFEAERFRAETLRFTSWWQNYHPTNAVLVWRDALPQHFETESGSYDPVSTPHPTFGAYTCRAAKDLCAQESFVTPTRKLVDPKHHVYSLPVHDWAGLAYYAHNIRSGDCTHYCIGVMAVWNAFLVRLSVSIPWD